MIFVAVVEFNYEDFKKLADYPVEKIVETLTEIGAPCEADGNRLIVEVTPNRPDLFFIEGAARAVRSYLSGSLSVYKTEKSKYAIICDKSVDKVRPFVRFAAVGGVSLDAKTLEYLIEAQEKLHETVGRKRKKVAIGIHDLDLVEFPLVYKIVDEVKFIPLGFDREMSVKEICETHPKGKTYGHLVTPGKYPMIFDRKGVISFPPIINSERTKLTNNTKNLLIDVTGTHEDTVEIVLNMIVCALADRGGVVYEVKVNGDPQPLLDRKKTPVDMKEICNLLGVNIKKNELNQLLPKMDLGMRGTQVLLPPYRSDIMHQVDIAEDLAIAYGYGKFEPSLPNFFTSGKLVQNTEIKSIMKGMGFSELKTFTLTNEKQIGESGSRGLVLKVKNPASEEYSILRPSLLVSILEVLKINKTKGLPQKLYEIGEVYPEGKPITHLFFTIVDRNVDFNEIRGVLQTLLSEYGVTFTLIPNIDTSYNKSKSGIVVVSGKKMGVVGELDDQLLTKYGLSFKVTTCELDLSVFGK